MRHLSAIAATILVLAAPAWSQTRGNIAEQLNQQEAAQFAIQNPVPASPAGMGVPATMNPPVGAPGYAQPAGVPAAYPPGAYPGGAPGYAQPAAYPPAAYPGAANAAPAYPYGYPYYGYGAPYAYPYYGYPAPYPYYGYSDYAYPYADYALDLGWGWGGWYGGGWRGRGWHGGGWHGGGWHGGGGRGGGGHGGGGRHR